MNKDEQLTQFQVGLGFLFYIIIVSCLFQSITGCDSERAQFYLESSNWQLDLAMASFYEGDGDMEVGGDPAGQLAVQLLLTLRHQSQLLQLQLAR